jgi:hypothetical protein
MNIKYKKIKEELILIKLNDRMTNLGKMKTKEELMLIKLNDRMTN